MFKNLGLRIKLMLGSAAPLVLVVVLSCISAFSIKSLLSSSGLVDHTHVVVQNAMKIEAAAVDMETGMRGYLLAGEIASAMKGMGGGRGGGPGGGDIFLDGKKIGEWLESRSKSGNIRTHPASVRPF